jgi:hypothetical protein
MKKHNKHYPRNKEQGSALVAALGIIFIGSILTAYTLSISKASPLTIDTFTKLQRSILVSESVLNRVQWLIAADRQLYSNVTLGETQYDDFDTERYIADTIPKTIDYYGEKITFTISDAAFGNDIANYRNTLSTYKRNLETDTTWSEKLTTLQAKIADYIDTNDDTQTDGMEKQDYEALNHGKLPRNDKMQYREELLWIPGAIEAFPLDKDGRLTSARIIPPEKMSFQAASNRVNLLNANILQLKTLGNLTNDEIVEFLNARNQFIQNRTPLSDSLDPLLSTRLSRVFTQTESGDYTVTILPTPNSGIPFHKLSATFSGFGVGGPSAGLVRYFEWIHY